MPHDSHTTHEPDRVGREGDDVARDEDVSRKPTLLIPGGLDPLDDADDLAPAS